MQNTGKISTIIKAALKVKQLLICACILIIAASCELRSLSRSSEKQKSSLVKAKAEETSCDSISLFFTGNVLGSLKPCGCSGGQMGGLDRRPAVFNTVPANKRMIIDTGTLVDNSSISKNSVQELIKYTIIIEALKYMSYDVVNLTKPDIEMSRQAGMPDESAKEFISSYEPDQKFPAGFRHEYEMDGQKIIISAVSFDPEEMPIEYIKQLFPAQQNQKSFNILILNNYSNKIITDISQMGVIDCLVCPIPSDEPTVISKPNTKPIVCGVGRFGRHISKLTIKNAPDDTFKLSFEDIPVKEEIKQDDFLVNLYKQYQERIKDANLLGTNPRYPSPDDLKYVGSEACESDDCHSEQFKHQFEYVEWLKSDHAKAYATLAEVGSQYDPECIVCHVIGYDFESGFKTADSTPKLKNVGCENCHGPGSKHCEDPYKNKMTVIEDRIKLCTKCHSPEHSGDFAGHEQEKLKIIEHWPEPNDVNNVK
jgi:hypothetical protein